MNRGARRAPVFVDDFSCGLFVDLLATLPRRFGVVVHGYALMPNHFHLMLESPNANLSDAMRFLTGDFTRILNKKYGWDGPVFRGRFRNAVVDTDAYWMHLLAYIHLNPVRAALVPSADDSHYTSHAAYTGLVRRPDWLTTESLTRMFGSKHAYCEYLDEVRVKRRPAPAGFDIGDLWRIESASQPQKSTRPAGTDALERVSRITGVAIEDLRRDIPTGRRARWLAVWWLACSGLTYAAAGNRLGMSRTTAHRMILALRRHRHEPPLAGWIEALESGAGAQAPVTTDGT
jgi:REP element-mobilizing transposase RayT